MKTARFRITGSYAVMFHNPAAMQRPAGTMKVKTIPEPEEEAAQAVYRTLDGLYYGPAVGLRNALVDGASDMRIGRKSASKLLDRSVFVTHEECVLCDPDTGEPLTSYEVDLRRVVIQDQGIQRARPKFPHWQTEIDLEYDEDVVTPTAILEAFKRAGRIVGWGEFRPKAKKGKGGPFGRFTTELIEGE